MATFTIELRKAVRLVPDIGLNDYPIWSENERQSLNDLILDTYAHYEIGFETVDMFAHYLNVRMRTIMPYYNKLALTEQIKYDPLSTMDIQSESNDLNTSKGHVRATVEANDDTVSDGSSRAVTSETPQTMLSESGDYATSATDSTSTTESHGRRAEESAQESESEGRGSSLSSQKGRTMAGAYLIQAYRETIINIKAQIVAELSDLFMGVWNVGDDYSHGATQTAPRAYF